MPVSSYIDFANGEVVEFTSAEEIALVGFQQAQVNTTDATVTTLATYTPPNTCFGWMRVRMIAIETTGGIKGLTGGRFIHFRKEAGTIAVLSVINDPADYLTTLTTATWTVDGALTDLRIRVTGEAATSINWKAEYEVVTEIQ